MTLMALTRETHCSLISFQKKKKKRFMRWSTKTRWNYTINIHNKANVVPDVTVSFSQITTIPKDSRRSLTHVHVHMQQRKSKVISAITAATLFYFSFFKVAHFFLTDVIVPLITFTPISWVKLLWNVKFASLCGEERKWSTKLYGQTDGQTSR